MFILQTFAEPALCTQMSCSYICDQINCFEVAPNLARGDSQRDAQRRCWRRAQRVAGGCGNVEEGQLFPRAEGGGFVREGALEGCALGSDLRTAHPERLASHFLPLQDELPGGWLTEHQASVYNPDLSLLSVSSRLPGWSDVTIAPEFSSGRQPSQQNIELFANFCFVVTNG